MEGKQTRGRQKIEMKKIENEEVLLVSFSKRRSGVYKKATDMIALSGGEVGIVIFSPSGKPFSYGHPSVDYVINRFMNQNPPENDDYTHQFMEAHRQMKISEAMEQYNELLDPLEAVKERQKSLLRKSRTRRNQEHLWWSVPIEELRVDELKQIHESMAELHMTISKHLKERSSSSNIFGASSSGSVQQTNPNFDADPSGTGSYAFPYGYGH
ncbi:agamous-like MADS-box protein AGL62 [Pyrus x bretschneideri]|uniref:agamous-like MADS-box protein AGL62 n=1 Tax=Pyrus x bretschneideri TaxID=225117 RepID=UPI00203084DB|nr:agamous-like MADS-box protein AGL62 [Pyrus x bretschneideri]